MNLLEVQEYARELGWPEEELSFFVKSARPSFDIEFASGMPGPASSRFGGDPFVPPDFDWPRHTSGRYRFLGQINFDDEPAALSILPGSGLLSLFHVDDDDSGVFWQDDGYVLGYYWRDHSAHVPMKAPAAVPVNPEIGFRLLPSLNVPRHKELRHDWPFPEADELVWDLSLSVNADAYLLGYPSYCTLAYDPTPGPDWVPLLSLGSVEDRGWFWHDGDRLMVFIQADRLRNLDFSNLKSDAG